MKKLSILLLGALTASSALAVQPRPSVLGVNQKIHSTKSLKKGQKTIFHSDVRPVVKKGAGVIRQIEKSANGVITDRPDGVMTNYSRNSYGYYDSFLGIDLAADTGACVILIEGKDGKHYINNLISGFPVDAWFECTLSGDKLTIPGGQLALSEDGVDVTLEVLEYTETDEEGDYVLCDKTEMVFTITDGVISSAADDAEGDYILGLYVNDGDDSGWSGYGDYNYVMTPFTGKTVTVPSVARQRWAMVSNGSGHFVEIVTDEEAVYVGGLFEEIPDGWVKAELSGDVATLPLSTYLGTDGNYYYFAQSSFVDEEWDDWYEEYVKVAYPSSAPVTFDFDRVGRNLKSDGCISLTTGEPAEDEWYAQMTVEAPEIYYQDRKPGTAPASASDLEIDSEYDCMTFNLPQLDVEGNLLSADRLFYNVYINGKLYTFSVDEYYAIPEDMTDIPYDFTDDWDFGHDGSIHFIYHYEDNMEYFGIRPFYVEDDGTKTYGALVNSNGTGAVRDIHEEGTAAFYNLHGLRVNASEKGLYIKRITDKNGNARTVKSIR